MKTKKNIKDIFIKISRISCFLFFVAIVLLVCVVFATKAQVIELPPILGIYFLISMIAFLICLVIAWFLDLVESIKRDKYACLIGYVVWIIVLGGAIVATDYMFDNGSVDWKGSLVNAVILVCAIKAGNFIFTKKK